jgi:hypothetical protein
MRNGLKPGMVLSMPSPAALGLLDGVAAELVEVPVDGDDFVPALEQAERHVEAHLPQADHREAHRSLS